MPPAKHQNTVGSFPSNPSNQFALVEETPGKLFPLNPGSKAPKPALGLMDDLSYGGNGVVMSRDNVASEPQVVDPPSPVVSGEVPGDAKVPQFKLFRETECVGRTASTHTLVLQLEECKGACVRLGCQAFGIESGEEDQNTLQNCTMHIDNCQLSFASGRTVYKNMFSSSVQKMPKVKEALSSKVLLAEATLADGDKTQSPTSSASMSATVTPSPSTSVPNMLPLSSSASPTNSPAAVVHESRANTELLDSFDLPSVLNMTIVSPTVRRFAMDGSPAPEWYLQPMVEGLWKDLSPASKKMVHFLILNSDKEPKKHIEAVQLSNHPGVTVLDKPNYAEMYGSLDDYLHHTGALGDDGSAFLEDGRRVNPEWLNWVAAEDLDGAYLLEKAMKMSPYVLFLEDDVKPTRRALQKLTKFVTEFERDDWLFIDLYTPNLDWAEGSLNVKNGGRYNFFCCTQAMLFRSDMLPGIIRYWRTHASEPVDDNLRNYRKEFTPNHWVYAMRPNLFEHVGAYSSNYQKSTGYVEHQSLDFEE